MNEVLFWVAFGSKVVLSLTAAVVVGILQARALVWLVDRLDKR